MNASTYDERKAVYQEAIERYGVNHQLNKFDEELGEFLAEYGRMRNGEGDRDKFAEELGDLSIMLEQMRLIFGVNDLVCEHMDMKIRRLVERLSKCDDISAAIRHFEHGISHDIFSEPVTSFARMAIDALKDHDFVCIHVEAPDEMSHAGSMEKKLKAIEYLDTRVIGPLLNQLPGDYRLLLLSDHPTLLSTRTHDGHPVPFGIYDSRLSENPRKFCEKNCANGPFVDNGDKLMPLLFEMEE